MSDTLPKDAHPLALTDEEKALAEPILNEFGNLCLLQGKFKGEKVAFICVGDVDVETEEFKASPVLMVVTEDMHKDCEAFDGQKIGEFDKPLETEGEYGN